MNALMAKDRRVEAIKRQHEMEWMAINGVVGVGTQQDSQGNLYICISVDGGLVKIKNQILKTFGGQEPKGVKILLKDTGEIRGV